MGSFVHASDVAMLPRGCGDTFVLVAASTSCHFSAVRMSEKRPPNILWYCTDQQRFDTIGALGNPHVKTPAIDALVEGGVGV